MYDKYTSREHDHESTPYFHLNLKKSKVGFYLFLRSLGYMHTVIVDQHNYLYKQNRTAYTVA